MKKLVKPSEANGLFLYECNWEVGAALGFLGILAGATGVGLEAGAMAEIGAVTQLAGCF